MTMLAMLFLTLALAVCCVFFVLERRAGRALRKERRALAYSQAQLQSFGLLQLIQGNTPDFDRLQDFYRIYHLNFDSPTFMLLVAKLRRYPYDSGPGGLAAAYTTVQEELNGILGLSAKLYFVETDGLLVCFYCEPRVTLEPLSENHNALRSLLYQQCVACTASLLDQHGIDVLIALGQYDHGGFALHTNYISAKALLEQAMFSKWSGNVVQDASELCGKTNLEFYDVQRQFYNCFLCFKFDAAAEHLFHMVQLRIHDYYDGFQEAREVVAEQLRFCTNMLELPFNIQLPTAEGDTIDIRDLMHSPDEDQLHKNLSRYFHGLDLHVTGRSAEAAPATDRVYHYIQSHYADSSISVSSISAQFHINVSYLSRQFKQEYGCGVLEFIHKQRIAAAKELINQGVPIASVFETVGYTSRRAFDSAFSRYEGITPKAYFDQLHA